MTSSNDKLDDLDAVRTIVDTLAKFDADTQERIIRWAREKLGLSTAAPARPERGLPVQAPSESQATTSQRQGPAGSTDIKSFVSAKNPSSNNEFTATVAYYYRFEAPEANRKDSINAEDLQEACRLAGRTRFTRPAQTLVNAHHAGLIDKAGDRGAYSISTVGENLVAMTLPSDGASNRSASAPKPSKKRSTKKKAGKATKVAKKTKRR